MDLTANDTITQSVNTFVNKEGRMLSAVNYVLRTYAYVFAGVLLIVINIPVSLIMIMRKTLRGSYLILAVLFFNNGFTGIGALLLGMKRLIYADNRRALVNHYHCVLDVSVLLLTAYFLNGFSLLMTSVERLCAVAFPIYYYTHNSRISYSLIAAQYIITVIAIAATVIASFIEPARFISHLCLLQNIYSPYFYKALLLLGAVASSLSVIFMIIVVVVLRKKFGAQFLSSHSQNNDLSHFLNNQKRYTHTAIISCSLTFFLVVVPSIVQFINRMDPSIEVHTAIIVCVYLPFLNSFNMITLFVWRQTDLRDVTIESFKWIFCGQKNRIQTTTIQDF